MDLEILLRAALRSAQATPPQPIAAAEKSARRTTILQTAARPTLLGFGISDLGFPAAQRPVVPPAGIEPATTGLERSAGCSGCRIIALRALDTLHFPGQPHRSCTGFNANRRDLVR